MESHAPSAITPPVPSPAAADAHRRPALLALVTGCAMALSGPCVTEAHAGWWVCSWAEKIKRMFDRAEDNKKLVDKITDPTSGLEEDDANIKKMQKNNVNNLGDGGKMATEVPLTSMDLGKTPTDAGKDALKGAVKSLIQDAAEELQDDGQSNLTPNVSNEQVAVANVRTWDHAAPNQPLTQQFLDDRGLGLLCVNGPSFVAGAVDVSFSAAISDISGAELGVLFGAAEEGMPIEAIAPMLVTGAPGAPSVPLFGAGEECWGALVLELARNPDGSPMIGPGGEISGVGTYYFFSGVVAVPTPGALTLVACSLLLASARRRGPSRVA